MNYVFFTFILLLFSGFVASYETIYPYQPQCQNPTPSNYEMNYPCNWVNEIGRWDMESSRFICYGVPTTYDVSYHIQSIGSNQYGYSVSLWTYDVQPTNPDYLFQMNYITYYWSEWMQNRPDNVQYPPLNGNTAYDYSSGNHDFSQHIQSNRDGLGMIIMIINREQYASQFPCYYFNVSFSIL